MLFLIFYIIYLMLERWMFIINKAKMRYVGLTLVSKMLSYRLLRMQRFGQFFSAFRQLDATGSCYHEWISLYGHPLESLSLLDRSAQDCVCLQCVSQKVLFQS